MQFRTKQRLGVAKRTLSKVVATALVASVGVAVAPFAADVALAAAGPAVDDFSGNYNSGSGWNGPWVESGDGASGPTGGTIQITTGDALRFTNIDSDSISRPIDLSMYTPGAQVELTFSNESGNESLQIQFRDGGGASDFSTVFTTDDETENTAVVTHRLDADMLRSDGEIRIIGGDTSWDSGEFVEIDNLRIEETVTNPDLPVSCGIDVTIVLDESGSIDTAGAVGDVEDAVRALISGLKNTGSRVRFTEFSTNGRAATVGGSTAFTEVDDTFETAVETYLTGHDATQDAQSGSGYNPGFGEQWTNWEAGLAPAVAGPGQLVVFITDGQPNTVGTAGSSNGGDASTAAAAAAAVDELDAIKAAGVHVLGIGVGGASTNANFNLLTSTIEPGTAQTWLGTGTLDVRTVDAMRVTNFDALDDALRTVVFALCAPSVSIRKVNDAGESVPNWDFAGSVDVAPTNGGTDRYEWVSPALGVTADDGTGNDVAQTVTTNDPSGIALFQWTPNTVNDPQPWASAFTWTEVMPAGWTLGAVPPCNVERLNSDGSVSTVDNVVSTVQNGTTVTFTLADPIQQGDIVSCQIENNRPGEIVVIKDAQPNAATDFEFTTTGGNGLPGSFSLDDDADGTLPNSVTYQVPAGSYSVSETGQSNWHLTSATCDQGETVADITVEPNETVTCTFVNVGTANLTLEKEWVVAQANDTAQLTATGGYSGASIDQTSTATGSATPVIDDTFPTIEIPIGQGVSLNEVINPAANYTSELVCRDDVNGSDVFSLTGVATDGRSGTVTAGNDAVGATITCRFSNPRKQAEVVVEKQLLPSTDDGRFDLQINGVDVVDEAGNGDNNAADPVTVNINDTVSVAEVAVAPAALANYTTSLSCAYTPTGGAPTNLPVVNGEFTVPVNAADATITCTFVNTRKSATLTLDKDWAVGSPDSSVTLTATGDANPANTDSATSESDGDPDDTASITIYAGETVDLSETFAVPADADVFDASLSCTQPGLSYTANDLTGVYTVSADPVNVACTFVNTPDEATFTLVKQWVNPRAGDAVQLTAGGDSGSNESIDESAPAPGDTTSTSMKVFAGETIDFDETFTGNAGDFYTTTVSCEGQAQGDTLNIDSGNRGGSLEFAGAPADVTCTFVNTRKSIELNVAKSWINAKTGDVVSITTTGATNNVSFAATADSALETDDDPVTYTVFAGETLSFSETFTTGDPTAYGTSLVCVGATDASPNDGLTISVADTAGNGIVCTYTNSRRSIEVQVAKDLVPDADPGRFDLTINGQPALTGVGDATSAPVSVFIGDDVTIAEAAADGSPALVNYTTTLECDNGVTATGGPNSGSFTVPSLADETVITCTFTNIRKSVQLTLDKDWVAAEASDTAFLDVDSLSDTPGVAAVAPAGSGTSALAVTATVYAGETVGLTEVLGVANQAAYDTTFVCAGNGETPVQISPLDHDLAITAADTEGAGITCTYTNTARRGTIVIVKSVVGTGDGTFQFAGTWPADGATIDPNTVTDPSAFPITTSGQTGVVTFTNVLVPKDGSPYTITETDSTSAFDGTEVTCAESQGGDQGSGPDGSTDLPLAGSIDLDNGETVTCTFTNTQRSTIVIIKNAVPDSAQDFTFTTTEPAPGDFLPDSFDLDDDADDTLSNTFTSVLVPGGATYGVTESATPGWTLDAQASSCTAGGSFDAATATMVAAPGTTVTCTFVNNADPAGLTATKAVSGVTGPWGPFTFTLAGGTFTGDASQDVSSTGPTAQWTELVDGQTYTLTEAAAPGYADGAVFTCSVTLPGSASTPLVDADPNTDGFQLVAVAGAAYSCDITNRAIPPTLVVNKTTVGGFGTFTFDITPTAGGADVPSVSATTSDGDNPAASTQATLEAGIGYTVTEQANDEFVAGTLTCTVTSATDVTSPYVFDTPTAPGDEIVCEITNFKKATIIVDKVTNPAAATDSFEFEQSWSGTIDGAPDFSLTDEATPENSGLVAPNVEYTVLELNPQTADWSLTGLTCQSANQNSPTVTSVASATATITPAPGDTVTCTFTNAQRGEVSVTKVVAADAPVTQVAGYQYSVGYDVTVTSASTIDEPFVLNDELMFGSSVTIDTATAVRTSATGPAANTDWNGGSTAPSDLEVAAGTISPTDTFTYRISVTFTVAGAITSGERDCVLTTDESGTGTLNTATVNFGDDDSNSADDCDEIPAPDISVAKTVVADPAQPVAVDDDTFTVAYDVVVSNNGDGPGAYSLTDVPTFGAGATITNIAVSSSELVADIDPYTAGADIVTDHAIEAGGSDTYQVVVTFDVAGTTTGEARDCELVDGENGTGTLNTATVTFNDGGSDEDDDCAEIPESDISIDKNVIGDPTQPVKVDGDSYTVTYNVVVSNAGDGPGAYTLTDTPTFGAGTTITNISVSSTELGAPIDPYTGGADIVTDQLIGAGDAHTYIVIVSFDVAGSITSEARDCDLADGEDGTGTLNSATVTFNDDGSDTSDDCAEIPDPNVAIDKSVVNEAAVRNADGTWTVTYLLEVSNSDTAGPGNYTLTDDFNFGSGVSVNNVLTEIVTAPAGTTLVGAFSGVAPTNVVVENVQIDSGASHSYRVVANVSISVGPGTDGDCEGEPGEATGLLNSLSITVNGETPDPSEACAGFATLTLVKNVINDDGGNATVASFPLTAAGPATLTGISGTGAVSSAVPAGTYTLSEQELAGYTAGAWSCEGGVLNGSSIELVDGDNAVCTIVNDDEPVDLELTKDDDGFVGTAGDPTPFEYTISVTNLGPRELDDEPVTVVDELPAAFTWVAPAPAGCVIDGQTLTCQVDPADLRPVNTTVEIVVTARVADGANAGIFDNQAWVTTGDDPVCEGDDCVPPPCVDTQGVDGNNNVDCEPTEVESSLSLDLLTPVCVADAPYIAYDITPLGFAPSGGATVTFYDMDGNLIETRMLASLTGQMLYPGASVAPDGSGTDWPGWAFEGGLWVPDPSDNHWRDGLRVVFEVNPTVEGMVSYPDAASGCADPEQVSADLAIVKTASVEQIGAGNSFTWTLDVANNGPDAATDVVIGDIMPSEVTVTGVSSDDFDCSNDGNDITCTTPSMAVGATGQILITVSVPPSAVSGTIVNLGTVESVTPDPDLTNNSDDATVIVVAIAPPTTPAPPPVTLPRTGSDGTHNMVSMALLLLGAGAIILLVARRRRADVAANVRLG